MTRIVVDPEALAGVGRAVTGVGDEFAAAVRTLSSSLGGGAPSGFDAAGLAFGLAYQKSAQALLDACAALVNTSHNVGFGIGMSAANYSQADAASTIGGGAAPLTAPEKPGQFDTPSSPSSLGGGVMPPFLWSVLENFIPDSWPDGNPGRLRASAAAWQSFASTINGIAGELSGPSGVIGSQQIPEGGAMTSAMSELSQSLSGVATEAGNLATQTRDFADDVQSTPTACTPTRPDCGATPTPTTTPESLRPTTAAPTPRTRHDRCTRWTRPDPRRHDPNPERQPAAFKRGRSPSWRSHTKPRCPATHSRNDTPT